MLTNAYGNTKRFYSDHEQGVPCRVVVKTQKRIANEIAQALIVTDVTVLFGPDTDIEELDHISRVVYEDGKTDERTFEIKSLVVRRTKGVAHKTASAEVLGGYADEGQGV